MIQMKKLYVLIIACCLCAAGYTQTPELEREVIATAGDTASAGGLNFSFTFGQMITETALSLNGVLILTQGFQQPVQQELNTSLEDELNIRLTYNIFPNPTKGLLKVELETDKPIELELSLFDMRGREIGIPARTFRLVSQKEIEVDLRSVADGFYTLMLKETTTGGVLKMFKIQRVN